MSEAKNPDVRHLFGIPGPIMGRPKPLTPEQMLGLPPGTIGRAWWQMKPWEAVRLIEDHFQESTASGEGQSG